MADDSSRGEGEGQLVGSLNSPSPSSASSSAWSIRQGVNGISHLPPETTPISASAASSDASPSVAVAHRCTSSEERTRELFFLIYRFLETTDLSEVRSALHSSLEASGLLPRQLDAITGAVLPSSTLEQVSAENGHIPADFLLRLVEQAEKSVSRLAPPPVSGVSSLLAGGRFSLLRSLQPEDAVRVRSWDGKSGNCAHASLISFLSNHVNHSPVVPSCRYTTGHPSNLLTSLISRELSGPKPITHLWPTRCYERYEHYKRILGHLSSVYCVSFDRTGAYIFTGADDRLVKIWSAADGRLLTTLRGHEEEITDMTVDYDNSMLATASCDKVIRVWCLKSTAPLAILSSHSGTITGLKFCPLMKDRLKRYLVSCSNDGTVCFWEYNAATRTFKGFKGLSLSFSLPYSNFASLSFALRSCDTFCGAEEAWLARPLPELLSGGRLPRRWLL